MDTDMDITTTQPWPADQNPGEIPADGLSRCRRRRWRLALQQDSAAAWHLGEHSCYHGRRCRHQHSERGWSRPPARGGNHCSYPPGKRKKQSGGREATTASHHGGPPFFFFVLRVPVGEESRSDL
ncbi:unnamed protein product [Ectocarpus sp. CCAP 1310/34]|nr:unnamed protein product [Ectocarpus sp. CCAP 1310/34]